MPTVFILDDDADILFVLNIWLEKNGYQVKTFTYAADLFEAIHKQTPDIVLLDLMISNVETGTSVCKELKQRYHFTNQIYLYSATHLPDTDVQKCGADGFIDKPFDLHDLLDTLNTAIGNKAIND